MFLTDANGKKMLSSDETFKPESLNGFVPDTTAGIRWFRQLFNTPAMLDLCPADPNAKRVTSMMMSNRQAKDL